MSEWYVDFGTVTIEADTRKQAIQDVEDMVAARELKPEVVSCEPADD